ncbi:MAG: ComF family protein [Actinobacteria bacterium]|nr:ComF family protein [Actinomycetota bacterium]
MCPGRGEATAAGARRLIGRVAALLAPPRCVACDSPTPIGAVLCGACEAAIMDLPTGTGGDDFGNWPLVGGGFPAPPDLGRRSWSGQTDRTRDGVVPATGALTALFAAFPMEWPARDLVHALKYRSAVAVANEMARLIAARVPSGMLDGALLVPVPAHPVHQRLRGYNQSLLLARELARVGRLPFCDCLERTSSSPPQTGLPRSRRLALDPAAFRARSQPIRHPRKSTEFPTNVVLLDDVVTTGVTLEVCAFAIRRRFGSEVRALTFAGAGAHPGTGIERCR